jgi:hypothetical protein
LAGQAKLTKLEGQDKRDETRKERPEKAEKTRQTVTRQHLTNSKHKKDIYDRCGVYKMKCIDCGGAYIGQTGRNFRVRYKEHTSIRDIRYNKTNTGYANHILNAGHIYGPLEDTLQVLGIQNKGPHLNSLERFHIYKEQKTDTILNDNYTDHYNPIFEFVTTRR